MDQLIIILNNSNKKTLHLTQYTILISPMLSTYLVKNMRVLLCTL
jgi:hypothetical protein